MKKPTKRRLVRGPAGAARLRPMQPSANTEPNVDLRGFKVHHRVTVLPPTLKQVTCPKCGSTQLGQQFSRNSELHKGEHVLISCLGCGYVTATACLDAAS